DDKGRITKVTFTTETPEYWEKLFRAPGGPDRVVALYRELLGNQAIDLAAITDSSGKYNPLNPWNTAHGIIHYIVDNPPNTLGAAVDLAFTAAALAEPINDNFESFFVQSTAADPRLRTDIHGLARRGLHITVADPVGIYIAGWNDTGWSKPDGSPVGSYW